MNSYNLLGFNVKLPMKSIFAINSVNITTKYNAEVSSKYLGTYIEEPSRRYDSDAFKYSKTKEDEELNLCIVLNTETAFPDPKIRELNDYSYYPRIRFTIRRNKISGHTTAEIHYPYSLTALRILNIQTTKCVIDVNPAEISNLIPNIINEFIENSKKAYLELNNLNTAMVIDYGDVQDNIETMFAEHGFTKRIDTDKDRCENMAKTKYIFRFTHPICGDADLTVSIEPNLFQIKDCRVMFAEIINRCTYNNTGYNVKFGTIEGLYKAIATTLNVYDYMEQRFTEAKNKFDLLPMV